LGYITGKGSSKLAQVKANLPLLFVASVLPDIDLLLRFLMHRGPTHSFITITILMTPFFIVYRKQVIPYYAALLSHILIGDFFTGGVELFWPLSQSSFGALNFDVTSLTNVIAELVLSFSALVIMSKLRDLQTLLKPHNKNWALIIPLGAVLGPLLTVGRGQEYAVPTLLVVPSLFYIGLFAYSMFVELGAERARRTPLMGSSPKYGKQIKSTEKRDRVSTVARTRHGLTLSPVLRRSSCSSLITGKDKRMHREISNNRNREFSAQEASFGGRYSVGSRRSAQAWR
jgi:membrane-bound metal-dependent hydrolase YbcI (DUF457 family)